MKRYEWRLKELMEREGLDFDQLAERLGKNGKHVEKLMKYRRVPVLPGPELEKLLKALNASLEELIVEVEGEDDELDEEEE